MYLDRLSRHNCGTLRGLRPSYYASVFQSDHGVSQFPENNPATQHVLTSPLVGTWQPYAVQLFLFVQHHTPLHTALYFIPTAIVGVLAVYVVQNLMHRFSNQWIFSISMLANALSPALFLPISPTTRCVPCENTPNAFPIFAPHT